MHEYPRFLTDQQSDLVQLRALKEEEKILRDYRQRAIKIAEEKRLRSESDNFVKEIQRNRLMGESSVLDIVRCHQSSRSCAILYSGVSFFLYIFLLHRITKMLRGTAEDNEIQC